MARVVEWAESAWDDLDQLAAYIARDSEYYAATFVRRVRDTSRSLKEFPQKGRVVPELKNEAIREVLVGSYRLVYEVTADAVLVLGVIHGARDFRTAWEERGTEPPA